METKKTTRDGRPVTTGVIRYFRPVAEFLDRDALRQQSPRLTTVQAEDNFGGITFAFEIDHVRAELLVGYSVCTENFDKARGRDIALEMLLKAPQRCLRVAHDKTLGLVDSVVYAIARDIPEVFTNELISNGLDGATVLELQRFRNLVKAVDDIYNQGEAADKFSKALKKTKIGVEARDARFFQTKAIEESK